MNKFAINLLLNIDVKVLSFNRANGLFKLSKDTK